MTQYGYCVSHAGDASLPLVSRLMEYSIVEVLSYGADVSMHGLDSTQLLPVLAASCFKIDTCTLNRCNRCLHVRPALGLLATYLARDTPSVNALIAHLARIRKVSKRK
jgi:hypothetical protein